MDTPQSQYLAQALQQMAQAQPAPAAQPAMSPQQMAQVVKQKQAWEAQNPGGNYMAHGVQQMGQNLMNAPQNVMGGLGSLAKLIPGQGGAMPSDVAGL